MEVTKFTGLFRSGYVLVDGNHQCKVANLNPSKAQFKLELSLAQFSPSLFLFSSYIRFWLCKKHSWFMHMHHKHNYTDLQKDQPQTWGGGREQLQLPCGGGLPHQPYILDHHNRVRSVSGSGALSSQRSAEESGSFIRAPVIDKLSSFKSRGSVKYQEHHLLPI